MWKFAFWYSSPARCLFLSFAAAFLLHIRLSLLNKRNQKRLAALTEEEKNKLEDGPAEVWDNDPRYIFMT